MKYLLSLIATLTLLIGVLPVQAISERQQIAELKRIQRQQFIEMLVAARETCGRNKACRREMVSVFFGNRMQSRRLAKRACHGLQGLQFSICVLERTIGDIPLPEAPVRRVPETPARHAEVVGVPEIPETSPSVISDSQLRKFDRLFAEHREKWGDAFAALLPQDLPVMDRQQINMGLDMSIHHPFLGKEKIVISGEANAKIDFTQIKALASATVEAVFPGEESFLASAEARLLNQSLFFRLTLTAHTLAHNLFSK